MHFLQPKDDTSIITTWSIHLPIQHFYPLLDTEKQRMCVHGRKNMSRNNMFWLGAKQEKQKTFTFEKLEPEDSWYLVIKIVGNHLSINQLIN